jgi:GNAT superfamily N-acetyltransferase
MIIREIQRNEINAVVELETQAFSDYDYFTYFFPDAKERQRVQKALIRCEYRTNLHHSCCLAAEEDGKIVATVQLNPPTYRRPSDLSYILHGWYSVYLAGQRKNIDAWLAMNKEAGEPCHAFGTQEEGVWYLGALTVSPKVQGTGIGTRFLDGIEDYVRKAGGKWLTLYTNSEKNIAFYRHRGFEVFDERTLDTPNGPMKNWSVKKAL